MKKFNVLVTASGGDIGQGVIKSLRMGGKNINIVATEINAETCGLFLADKGYVIESVLKNKKRFLSDIVDICKKDKIDIVFSCFEDEQTAISEKIEWLKVKTKAYFVVQPSKVLKICQKDKLKTYKFLASRKIRVPETYVKKQDASKLVKKHKWPIVLKPRQGRGSKEFYIIDSSKELNKIWPTVTNPILQEYINNGKDEEYTVGVFLTKNSEALGSITMLRKLRFGMTWYAVVDHKEDMADVAERAAESVGAVGPCNVQLRRDSKGDPCVIEINARISSTTVFRAKLGFNEALSSIDYFLKNRNPHLDYKEAFVTRLFDECIVPIESYQNIKKQGFATNL